MCVNPQISPPLLLGSDSSVSSGAAAWHSAQNFPFSPAQPSPAQPSHDQLPLTAVLIVQEKEQMGGKHQRGGPPQLGAGGGEGPGSPPTPGKEQPDSKSCEAGLKPDLGTFATKLKVEPGDSPHSTAAPEPGLACNPRLGGLEPEHQLTSPGHYAAPGPGKEECLGGGHGPAHPGMAAMAGLEHHGGLVPGDPVTMCHNFSVDSIMTTSVSRDPSPDTYRGYPGPGQVGPSSPGAGHQYNCLYPGPGGGTSLEELSSMTAACLSQQMSGMPVPGYPRPSWYAMPHPAADQTFPHPGAAPRQPDYFEPLGKAPSPLPAGGCADQGPYRSPSYRTNYYSQDCEKY